MRRHLASLCRALSRWAGSFADRLDPPSPGAELERAEAICETLAHVEAGRIRKRRGESQHEFARRLVAGDFVIVSNVIDFAVERAKRAQRAKRSAKA